MQGSHEADSVQGRLGRSEVPHGSGMLSFGTSSLLLGVICGTFVQFSSLAANYYVWMLRRHHHQHQLQEWGSTITADDDAAHGGVEVQTLLLMNLCWSMFTSLIAFSVLALLRMMIDQNDERLIQLESTFTLGALGGLFSSWILTDAALGIDKDLRINVLVIVVASVCWKLTMSYFAPRNCETDVDGMSKPLLTPTEREGHSAADRNAPDLRWMAAHCGLLIGLFIQLSGLGANSLLLREAPATDRERLLLSVGWSFLTSCLGILALSFVRQIILIGSHGMSASRLVVVECYFASGATVGLNAAWTITDIVLGLKPHIWGSAIATLVTFGWCKLILHCTEESCDNQDNQQLDEEEGTTSTLSLDESGRDEGLSLQVVDVL
jgi:hypothetical protein